MFEATLYTADPDRQRLQRLTLAAAIALAATTVMLASAWSLERMHIDRLAGPAQQFELLQLSLLPPKLIDPPPPPPVIHPKGGDAGPSQSATETKPDDPKPLEVDSDPSPTDPKPPTDAGPLTHGNTIPDFGGGIGCPGGTCLNNHKTAETETPCVGPLCGNHGGSTANDVAPKEVEFSALRCLACADPDRAALRKTAASLQARDGTVVARFCVDLSGRVEPNSIKIERSHGDAAVDQITRAAIEGWRFSPMKVGNQTRRACSRAKFNIRFD